MIGNTLLRPVRWHSLLSIYLPFCYRVWKWTIHYLCNEHKNIKTVPSSWLSLHAKSIRTAWAEATKWPLHSMQNKILLKIMRNFSMPSNLCIGYEPHAIQHHTHHQSNFSCWVLRYFLLQPQPNVIFHHQITLQTWIHLTISALSRQNTLKDKCF